MSADPPGAPGEPAHHDDGLDLARSIARSLAGARRAGRASARPRRRTDPAVSGAHPDDRDPQPLDKEIGRLVSEQGWSTDLRVHAVFGRWDRLVGAEIAIHCHPESFTRDEGGGRLVVRADSTAWATQLRLLAATVVRRLNEELGDGTVRFVEVRGPSAPSWKKGRRSVRDGRGPRDTYG